MKTSRNFFGLLIVVALLASCGGAASSNEVADDGEIVRGGTLTIARSFDTASLDPMGSTDNGSIFARVQIFDTLVRADPDTSPNVGAGLAEKWSVSSDGLIWTFNLREAKFSNGEPLTAEDVKFSLDRFMDPDINANLGILAAGMESVEIVDPKTIEVKLSHPIGAFLENLSVFPASIVNKKLVELEGADHWTKPVGTGPFMVKEWVSGSHLILEKNPNYWESGKPYLDEVRFDFVADDNARLLRIKGGQADIVEGVPWNQIISLNGSSGFKIQEDLIGRMEFVALNHDVGSLSEVGVRQALNYAVDKEAINQSVYGGAGEVANSMIAKAKYHDESVPSYAFNLEKAKSLMAKSSTPNGFKLSLIYPSGSEPHKQLATILQDQWSKIGVTLTIEEVDQGSLWSDRFTTRKFEAAIPLTSFTADVSVPDELATIFFDDDPKNAQAGIYTGWKIPKDLIENTKKAAFTSDEKVRQEIWPKVQAQAMAEAPWVMLYFLPSVHAVSNKVHGFKVLKEAWWDLEDVWVKS